MQRQDPYCRSRMIKLSQDCSKMSCHRQSWQFPRRAVTRTVEAQQICRVSNGRVSCKGPASFARCQAAGQMPEDCMSISKVSTRDGPCIHRFDDLWAPGAGLPVGLQGAEGAESHLQGPSISDNITDDDRARQALHQEAALCPLLDRVMIFPGRRTLEAGGRRLCRPVRSEGHGRVSCQDTAPHLQPAGWHYCGCYGPQRTNWPRPAAAQYLRRRLAGLPRYIGYCMKPCSCVCNDGWRDMQDRLCPPHGFCLLLCQTQCICDDEEFNCHVQRQ